MSKEQVYKNSRYRVELDRECVDDLNYLIVNAEYETVEERCGTLPQAMILAKQFEMLLIGDRWEKEVIGMYYDGLSEVGGNVPH